MVAPLALRAKRSLSMSLEGTSGLLTNVESRVEYEAGHHTDSNKRVNLHMIKGYKYKIGAVSRLAFTGIPC